MSALQLGHGQFFTAPLGTYAPEQEEWTDIGYTHDALDFSYQISSPLQVYYDEKTGTLGEEVAGLTRKLIDVRAGLVEDELRKAVIAELERVGYVVFGPYRSEPEQSEPAQ